MDGSDSGSAFHPDEVAVQRRVGVDQRMDAVGRRNVRDFMPEQHREFFAQLSFLFMAALDRAGQPWATVLAGEKGFLSTPDARTLQIGAAVLPGDALEGQLQAGDYAGTLGLWPSTRRRNRANGVIEVVDGGGLRLAVRQSFGNCPQYIQARDFERVEQRVPDAFVRDAEGAKMAGEGTGTGLAAQGVDVAGGAAGARSVLRSAALTAEDRALIERADTFFIASANVYPEAGRGRGVDISHRGGRPGFVRVGEDGVLTAPDFVGNFFFNTIGNLVGHPRAGLLFIDYATGDLLQIAVEAEVVWGGPEVQAFAGAERLLRFRVREVRRNPGALPFRWSAATPSPYLERTGNWQEAQDALALEAQRNEWRPFVVAAVEQESTQVRSFYLEPADGQGVARHTPGQFVPLRVMVDGVPLVRNYTVSEAPNGRYYRISVKRGGKVSEWLHAQLDAGGRVELMAPRGAFVFDHSAQRPAVLISAGIGITPMVAMLNGLLVNGNRSRHPHALYVIHGARSRAENAFGAHLQALERSYGNLAIHTRYSALEDTPGNDESEGHVDIALLQELLPFGDYDFYLCGPGPFMQQMYDGLRRLNVADERIRFEAFGPASVRRTAATAVAQAPAAVGADVNADEDSGSVVEVRFERSGASAQWDASKGSLLELAEAEGIDAPHACRSGMCGACAVHKLSGEVRYPQATEVLPTPGQVLTCSAVPRAGQALVLDL
jgi:ferredoxin-NADP reductase/predicted pyridoxine 5'-phosphate oxidase superfamily flavin-nucleotide-binding protein